MLKKIILFAILITFTSCAFNKDASEISNRRVVYKVNTLMPNVELFVDYYVDNNVSKSVIVDKFPWEIEAYIYPYNKIGMSGYLRYKDESLPVSKYIDLKLMIDVDNEHLNRADTIFIESVEAGATSEDLKKNTRFDLQLEPIE